MDNLNILCVDAHEVKKMIQWLESEYGEMQVSLGRRHDYLGLLIDYSIPGVSAFLSMEEHLRAFLDDFPEDITETPETPAASNIFNVRDDSNQDILNEKWAHTFHHAVTQLLFTGIQFRKYTQTTIDFLTARVRDPDEDDWKKGGDCSGT